jgi:hypothetical protein
MLDIYFLYRYKPIVVNWTGAVIALSREIPRGRFARGCGTETPTSKKMVYSKLFPKAASLIS